MSHILPHSNEATTTDRMLLKATIDIAEAAKKAGNHPFGALLADATGKVLLRSGNSSAIDHGTGHAELNVAREASRMFSAEFLEKCTLVTSVEPCCMCAGSVYWAGIGRLVFGMTEKRLATFTGDNPENLTMDMPCQRVFDAGQRQVIVVGPVKDMEEQIAKAHEGFW